MGTKPASSLSPNCIGDPVLPRITLAASATSQMQRSYTNFWRVWKRPQIPETARPLDIVRRHPGTHDARVLPMTVHQALRQYLRTHAVIAPRREAREIAMDLPRTVFSQDAALAGGDLSKAPTTPFGLPAG